MVNKNSPKYLAYLDECEQMRLVIVEKKNALRQKLDIEQYRGKDHPKTSDLDGEFSRRLKEIQRKYGFL